MKKFLVWIAIVLLAISPFLIVSAICHAGPKEQVAVAEAWVWACQNAEPVLPADTFRYAPPVEDECVADAEMPQNQSLPSIDPTPLTASELEAIERMQRKYKNSLSQPPTYEVASEDYTKKLPPLSMSIPRSTVVEQMWLPAHLVIGGWEKGCPHCVRLERDVTTVLSPLGWTIGHSPSDQIQFTHISYDEPAPRIQLYQNGRVIQTWTGYQDPGILSHALKKAWTEAGDHPRAAQLAKGVAGTIHAAERIHAVLDWFHDHVGEGVVAEIRWDRTGAQSFPLLAKGDWSALAVFGKYGHIRLAARGAVDLPIEEIGFGYVVDGNDITIALDPVTIKDLALKFGSTEDGLAQASLSAGNSQFSPLDLLTVFQVIQGLTRLLCPSVDLTLGGNVMATAVLHRDELRVDFQQCPRVRILSLFTFDLGVRDALISTERIHIDFSGSQWIKSREFAVQ